MKTKKKGKSLFSTLIVIVLLVVVILTAAANIICSGDKIPQIGNYYLYTHEVNDMEPDIPQNTLVIAKKSETTSLTPGNKVLCYLSDGTLALRVIYQITVSEDGSTNYYPGTALDQGSELTIPRSNIFAICTWQSPELYEFVTFATSVSGIMTLLVVPCIILIIMLLVRIVRSSSDDMDDEEFLFAEAEKEIKKRKHANNPLFEPGTAPPSGESLELKKSSIQDHFERKPVNENSPYQKAVQERTMKFRIQQQNIEEAAQQTQSAAPKSGTQVYSTQTIEEAARQQAEETPVMVETPVQQPEPQSEPVHPAPAPALRTETPNIDDIVRPSELRAAKSGQKINPNIAATDSIDDLLRVLESEKKKLL